MSDGVRFWVRCPGFGLCAAESVLLVVAVLVRWIA